jgi:hypothetical protein
MKKIFFGILVLLIAGADYGCPKKESTAAGESPNKHYANSETGISFTYPEYLTASTAAGMAILHHDIPYENGGACDMMGDEKKYDRLTDFEMNIRIIDRNLTETVKTISPYIPQENFANGELMASPGFIDPCTIGRFSGFAIYEGAEGCGHTRYYFRLSGDKTLVLTNASIQALSGAIVQEKVNEVLAVPGVISREKNMEVFESIVRSLIIDRPWARADTNPSRRLE